MKNQFKVKTVREVNKLKGKERTKYFSLLIKEFRKEYSNQKQKL